MKPIPFFVRLRALFTNKKEEFWWHYFTDEELQLRKMDAWELAGEIEEARVRPGHERKRIVAEHMLNVRLAQIQAKASWGSGLLGFVGALVGSALSIVLAAALPPKSQPECTAPATASPAPSNAKPIKPTSASTPSASATVSGAARQ